MEYKTGDIMLIHTFEGVLPKAIRHYQMKEDITAGYYNHSALIYVSHGRTYVAEMNYKFNVKGIKRFLTATLVFTPVEFYLNSAKYRVLLLKPKEPISPDLIGQKILEFVGTPYDIQSLVFHQRKRILQKIWKGSTNYEIAKQQFVCHEFVQTVWQELRGGSFPECYKGNVCDIYYSKFFNRIDSIL